MKIRRNPAPGFNTLVPISLLFSFFWLIINLIFKKFYLTVGSSLGEWLGHALAVVGVEGSSLLTASQRCDGLNSPNA